MENINNIKDTNNYYIFDFKYIYFNNTFIFLEYFPYRLKNIKVGKIYIRKIHWSDVYDCRRISSHIDPYNRNKTIVDFNKFKFNKIRHLCEKIEDAEGNVEKMDSELSKEIDPDLGNFIINKVDEVIYKHYDFGLDEEETKKLSNDCSAYYRAVNKARYGDTSILVPEPPSIILLCRISEILNCNFEDAKKLSKRDVDSVMIMKEQENLCKQPALIGQSDPQVVSKYGNKYDKVFSGH